MPTIQYHWLDHKLARIIALLISIAALLLAAMVHQAYNPDHINSVQSTIHPDYARCMEGRMEAIESMVAENIITDQKAALFTKRATALCSDKFPSH